MARNSLGLFVHLRKNNKLFNYRFNEKKISNTFMRLSKKKSFSRFNRKSFSLFDSIRKGQKQRSRQSTMAMPLYLRKRNNCSRSRFEKETFDKILWLYEKTINQRKRKDSWNVQSSSIWRVALNETTVSRLQSSCISQLWRKRNYSLRSMDKQLREFLGRYGADLAERTRTRSNRQQQRLQSRKLSMDKSKKQCQEQKDESNSRFAIRSNDRFRISRENSNRSNNIIVSSGSWMAKGIAVRKTGSQKQVYDIRNCGSRHRFTVWDPGGECLRIVSNCTQATARDLLAEAMWRMEQAGLDIVAHVHDEVVLEVPKGTITVNDVCKIMNQNPAWAEGLPLASDGYSGNYYFKS